MPDAKIAGMPRNVVIFGGVAAAGVVGYLIYRHITKPTTTTTTTPGTTQGYGYNYGYGYGSSIPYGEYGFGGGLPFPGAFYGYGGGGGSGQPPPITTNAEWGQAAEAAMGSSGSDAIAAAIAKYLAGAPVTQDQALIVQEAEAVVGPPPQAAASGYPPKIKVTNGNGGGGGAQNPVTGLHVTQQGTTGVDIAWTASQGATSYQVTSTHGNPRMTGATSARIGSVNPAGRGPTAITVQVLAQPAASGATPASVQASTRK